MNRFRNFFKPRMRSMALLLAAFVAGCGGGGADPTAPPAAPPIVPVPPAAVGAGPAPVNLGTAGNFVILAKSGITNVPTSVITGNIGTSPITGAAITGLDCLEVTGTVYTVDVAGPTCRSVDPVLLTTAVLDMGTAYTDAAGRTLPDFNELGTGNISGMTLVPGLYKWSNVVLINSDVTLNGGPNDVWIFQIAGGITQAANTKVILTGGALAKNVFWRSAGVAALGAGAHMEGIVMSVSATLSSGATVNGRLLSQTNVTLIANTVAQPGTTVVPADITTPTVISTIPMDLATGVAVTGNITATFSEAMAPASINTTTFSLMQGVTPVPSTVTYAGTVATLAPTLALAANTVYTATLTTGATDVAGNPVAGNSWSFTTAVAADVIAPTVISTIPMDLATGVAVTGITATFSEAMAPATINAATFTLMQGVTPVSGAVTYTGNVATLAPTLALAANTVYTATLTTGATDLAGNALLVVKAWSFTTAATVATGRTPVNLGTAGNFVILSKSGITNVPTSVITGNIGTSPITGAAITGLGCPEVTGTVYTVDATGPACRVVNPTLLTTAVLDMGTAYTDAAGRTLPDFTELGAGNISGLTLVPGLYKWSNVVLINTDVTLNGGPTDVWIFQIAGGITQAANTKVILTGGALAKNVFWRSAGVAALGAGAHMEGIVMSVSATLSSGATVNGRLLSQTNVTLIANTVAQPGTTVVPADTVAPTVSSTVPMDMATGVAITGSITVTFSEAMAPATISAATFSLMQGVTPVPSTVTYAGTVATLAPTLALAANTVYTATLTTGATDVAGNPVAGNSWSFTTAAAADVIAPTVISTIPMDLATGVAVTSITATFSEAMAPATINTVTFSLMQGVTAVPSTVTYAGTVATLVPTLALAANTLYTATLTMGATDIAGNMLAGTTWSFTTAAVVATGLTPVNLGTAGNFVILSKTGITNVPTSVITGNIGTSPITGAAITGLGCPEVTGTVYTVDATGPACRVVNPTLLTTAVLDMGTAYTDAAGRTLPDFTELGAGNISGLTLVPGLYKWSNVVLINTDVTLNGGPTDVWIFQIAGGITQAANTKVILTGGALAKNVFWRSAGVAALGAGAHMEGIVMSVSATLSSGATVNGRLLSQSNVTLIANTVAQPAP